MSSKDGSIPDADSIEDHEMDGNGYESPRSSIPIQKLSCEPCRARKVRCDRSHPCTPCVRKHLTCTFPRGFKSRQKRQRPLPPATCQDKIDEISTKLDQIRSVIDSIGLSPDPVGSAPASQSRSLSRGTWTPATSSYVQSQSPLAATAQDDLCEADLEGEASLKTHAAHAANLVQQMVDSAFTGITPDLTSSLDALRKIVQTSKKSSVKAGILPAVNLTKTSIVEGLEMPALETAMMCLGKLKDRDSMNYLCFIEVESIGDFVEYLPCCYSKTPSNTDLMIVNAGLARLFHDCSCYELEPHLRAEYEGQAMVCHQNLEILVSRLPLFAPHTFDLALALTMASTQYMSMARPRMAWKLVIHSAHICQSLGFQRRDALGTEGSVVTRRQKRLFLFVYVTEKSLAFRLGKASTIRSSEAPLVDVGMPDGYNSPLNPLWRKWIAICLLQDEVYDHLCSPRALMQSDSARAVKARTLAAELEKLLFTPDIAEARCVQGVRDAVGDTMGEIFSRSEKISGLAMLTLIYRAVPPDTGTGSVLSAQCISAAVDALEEHQQCVRILERADGNMLDFYLHWALLAAPFVPYIVIFCLAIETSSPLYLTKLASVVDATEKVANTYHKAYEKQLAIFRLMYDVACKWVEARNANFRPSEIATTRTMNMTRHPTATAPDSSLQPSHTMGFESQEGEQPGAILGGDGYGLHDWMDQNYQIFQLLDDDAFLGF